MKKALFYGILGSLFFAFTFVFNRSINLGGGYWMWSGCLRYLFTLPLMGLLVGLRGGIRPVLTAIREKPAQWLLWSTVGFGLFYLPLTMASQYGESWFVAATWQITIVCGILLTPLLGGRLPIRNLLCSAVILLGIALLQVSHFASMKTGGMLAALALILIGAFAYPLGNRRMMAVCPKTLSTNQRVFGMTLCSMPFWLAASAYAIASHGLPSSGQTIQSFIVALFSGVIATVLFFAATDMVRSEPKKLAVIEATQSGEVIFTLIGGILFLGDSLPTPLGFVGIALVIVGMVANSLCAA